MNKDTLCQGFYTENSAWGQVCKNSAISLPWNAAELNDCCCVIMPPRDEGSAMVVGAEDVETRLGRVVTWVLPRAVGRWGWVKVYCWLGWIWPTACEAWSYEDSDNNRKNTNHVKVINTVYFFLFYNLTNFYIENNYGGSLRSINNNKVIPQHQELCSLLFERSARVL